MCSNEQSFQWNQSKYPTINRLNKTWLMLEIYQLISSFFPPNFNSILKHDLMMMMKGSYVGLTEHYCQEKGSNVTGDAKEISYRRTDIVIAYSRFFSVLLYKYPLSGPQSRQGTALISVFLFDFICFYENIIIVNKYELI